MSKKREGRVLKIFCPNCGCVTLGKDCEWCGPARLYERNPKFCTGCGGLVERKEHKDTREGCP